MSAALKTLAKLPRNKRALVLSRLPPHSFAQQRLWFIDQLESGSAFYNLSAAIRVRGNLNISVLQQTLTEVVRRHEILRTIFAEMDGQLVQLIQPPAPVRLPVIDLTNLADARPEAEALARAETQRLFDLSQETLFRVRLLQLSAAEYIILLTMHHIVSDGWSIGVVIKEVAALYTAFSAGNVSP